MHLRSNTMPPPPNGNPNSIPPSLRLPLSNALMSTRCMPSMIRRGMLLPQWTQLVPRILNQTKLPSTPSNPVAAPLAPLVAMLVDALVVHLADTQAMLVAMLDTPHAILHPMCLPVPMPNNPRIFGKASVVARTLQPHPSKTSGSHSRFFLPHHLRG